MPSAPNRDYVLQLIERIRNNSAGGGDDAEANALIDELERNVPHPQVSDLIFWPDLCGYDRDLTTEEIADIALAYQPPTT